MNDDMEFRWHDLKTEMIPPGQFVILFPAISDVGLRFDTELYRGSNPEYARLRALEQGFTSWFPVPHHPDAEAVEARIKEMYQEENDGQVQWHKGFNRAACNIVEALKQLAPDRPHLALAIAARFDAKEAPEPRE